MPHRTGFYQRGFEQIEKFFYGAAGTSQGIASSKTARDLQDYYIRGPKVKFQKPGFNQKRWQRYYQNRYNPYKRRVKGDIVIESSNTQQEALRTDIARDRGSGSGRNNKFGKLYRRNPYSSRPYKRRSTCEDVLRRILARNGKYKRYR